MSKKEASRQRRPVWQDLAFANSCAYQESLNPKPSLEVAADLGCSHFYLENSELASSPIGWTDEATSAFRQAYEAKDVRPIMHGNYRNPIAHEIPRIRLAAVGFAMEEIRCAARFGAVYIAHGSAFFSHSGVSERRRAARRDLLDSLERLAAVAAPLGVDIWLENLENYTNGRPFHTIFAKSSDYVEVLDNAPEQVGFILDLGHENIGGDPLGVFERHQSRIRALSLSNNDGSRDQHRGLADGTLDYARVVAMIEASGWRGHLTFETRGVPLEQGVQHLYENSRFGKG